MRKRQYIYLAAYELAKMIFFYNLCNIYDWSSKSIQGLFVCYIRWLYDIARLYTYNHVAILSRFNSMSPLVTLHGIMDIVDIGLGNGLLPADT